jgi:putative addiction module component (TIGR02574 family)
MGDFRNQIGNLSAAEKLELLDMLWESLEDDAPLTDAQRAELDFRMARYEQNPAGVIPWEQVRAACLRDNDAAGRLDRGSGRRPESGAGVV